MKENSDENSIEYFVHLKKIKLFNPPLDLSLSSESSYDGQKYQYLLFSYRDEEKLKNANQGGFMLLFNKNKMRAIVKVADDSIPIKISDLQKIYGTDNIVSVMGGFSKSENVEIVESNEKNPLQNIEHSQCSGINKSPDIGGCTEELKVNTADINLNEKTKNTDVEARKEDKNEVSEINKNKDFIEELMISDEIIVEQPINAPNDAPNAEALIKNDQKNNMQDIIEIPFINQNIIWSPNLLQLPKVTQNRLQSLCTTSNTTIRKKVENPMKEVI